jgi:hypothetical protein
MNNLSASPQFPSVLVSYTAGQKVRTDSDTRSSGHIHIPLFPDPNFARTQASVPPCQALYIFSQNTVYTVLSCKGLHVLSAHHHLILLVIFTYTDARTHAHLPTHMWERNCIMLSYTNSHDKTLYYNEWNGWSAWKNGYLYVPIS